MYQGPGRIEILLGLGNCSQQLCLDLLHEAGMLAIQPNDTPIEVGQHLVHDNKNILSNITCYRRIISRLIYLKNTRPYIFYVVGRLSQFLEAPTPTHQSAVFQVLKYLKNNPREGLFFPATLSLKLLGYSDSDWGTCKERRRSISTHCFFIGTRLISWKSKKQKSISRSSCEAKHRALANATCEAQWLLNLLKAFCIPHQAPAVIFCDNDKAIHIANNHIFHEHTKHIDMDCHIVRDRVEEGIIHLTPIQSKEQISDFLTKPLCTTFPSFEV
jgi:hypothetical protein